MPDPTRHVLVVAGRTADPVQLRSALLGRQARGPAEFTLLLPAAEHDRDAPQRLLETVELLRASGLDVAGRLGVPDPLNAVIQVWDPMEYDEIVLNTLPPSSSRWLAYDVPGRIRRATGAEVIVAFGPESRPRGANEPPNIDADADRSV